MADSQYIPDDEEILERLNESHYITTPKQLESILGRSPAKEARDITPEVVFGEHLRFAPEEVHQYHTLDGFYKAYAAKWVTSSNDRQRYAAALMGGEDEWRALMDDSSQQVRCAVAQAASEELQCEMLEKDDAIVREALCLYGTDRVRFGVLYLEAIKENFNRDVLSMAAQTITDPKLIDDMVGDLWDKPEQLALITRRGEPSRDTLIRLSVHDSAEVRTAVGYAAADAGFEDIVKTVIESDIREMDSVLISEALEDAQEEKAAAIEDLEQSEPQPERQPAPSLTPEKIVLTAETTEERVTELTGKVDSTFEKLVSSGHFGDIITTMTKFPRYSIDNAILITAQAPNATQLLESKTWAAKYDKRIRKGEKSIKVLAPIKNKGRSEEEPQYKVVSMFDAAQLQGGAPQAESKKELTDKQLDGLIDKLTKAAPFEVKFEALPENQLVKFGEQKDEITFNSAADKKDIAHAILSNFAMKSPVLAGEKDLIVYTAKSRSITALCGAELGLNVPTQSLTDLKYLSVYSIEDNRKLLKDIRTAAKELTTTILEGKTATKAEEKQEKAPEPSPTSKEGNAPLPEEKTPEPPMEPVVSITKSENQHFTKGDTLTLDAANDLISKADGEIKAALEAAENKDVNNERIEYSIEFEIDGEKFVYNAQQDLGAGEGSMIDHIKEYHEFCLSSEMWKQHIIDTKGEAAWEQESALSKKVLDTVVPYLEQKAQEKSKEAEEPTKAEPEPEPLDIESIPPLEWNDEIKNLPKEKPLMDTPIREQLANAQRNAVAKSMQAAIAKSQPAPEL